MSEGCQGEKGRCRHGEEGVFCTDSLGARERTISTSECAGSAPLMSHFLMLQKMNSTFSLPWKMFVRINEMVLIQHLGERHNTDN